MKLNKWICYFGMVAVLLTLSIRLQAGTAGSIGPITRLYQPLASFTIGPDFVQKGRAQTLSLIPPFQNHYTNTNSSTTVADAGVFVGVERAFGDTLWVQLGVSGYVDEQFSPRGEVWQFAVPEFNTLAYSYNIHHTRVMAEGKFLTKVNRYQSLHPYISWGLGAAFNQASNYHEAALIPLAVPMAPFTNNSQSSFTWGLGVGMDYNLNQHTRVGIGYQFTNLGSASLGITPAETTTQTLYLSHLYTNQLRFQFTFLV